MPTYRVTLRHPCATPYCILVEDVDADGLRREGSGNLILIRDQVVIILTPRTVVVRRLDPAEWHVEQLAR